MLWKSQPTPAISRRTTGYEGASTVPEVNLVGEPSRLQEPRAGPVEVRVEDGGGAEVRPDRGRPALVERRLHLRREVVEQLVPRHRLEAAVAAQERPVEPLRMVVELAERPPLGARVALRDGVVAVALHASTTRSPSCVTTIPQ